MLFWFWMFWKEGFVQLYCVPIYPDEKKTQLTADFLYTASSPKTSQNILNLMGCLVSVTYFNSRFIFPLNSSGPGPVQEENKQYYFFLIQLINKCNKLWLKIKLNHQYLTIIYFLETLTGPCYISWNVV